MRRRPLDPLHSIKLKLGLVIVAAVIVTLVVNEVGLNLNIKTFTRGLIAVALALGMVQLLARGMTSPLREMADAAAAMARGDYERRVTATSKDEVGDLARAFNAMAGDLAEVDRMRRDLVANVSHELRTPISALQAALENVIDGVQPADAPTLRAMHRQVERLGRLVSQLLDLSRLESGGAPLERRAFDVGQLLEDAADESRLHAPNTPIVVELEHTDLRIDGDANRVHQVVTNLVANAVRHSPEGEVVTVRGGDDSGRVRIEVCDRGSGIAPEDVSRVFERFYRADAARAATDGGAGLGLSIARWIVDLHGGDIRVEPNEPQGCRMVVVLPGVSS